MKRHSTDVLSLVFGLLFLSVSAWWAVAYYLNWTANWDVPNFGWIAAGVLIVVGLFGVMASLRRDRPEPALAEGPQPFDRPTSEEAQSTSAETPGGDPGSATVDLGPTDSMTDVPRDDRDYEARSDDRDWETRSDHRD